MTLGLRILAIEFLNIRERMALAGCAAAVCAVGLVFLLDAG